VPDEISEFESVAWSEEPISKFKTDLLYSQTMTAFRSASFDNSPALRSRHSLEKPMGTLASEIARLKR
jgi:hypothetical protein